jgi:hypothetical protein
MQGGRPHLGMGGEPGCRGRFSPATMAPAVEASRYAGAHGRPGSCFNDFASCREKKTVAAALRQAQNLPS